jgi:hypothetical protein
LLKKYIIVFILIAVRKFSFSQEIWTGIITNTKINQRFSIWNDVHVIPQAFFIYRTGLGIELHQKLQFTGGYAFLLLNRPNINQLDRNEHRPWFQFEFRQNITNHLQLRIRHRNDIRFIENLNNNESSTTYSFQNRWRWMASMKYTFLEFNNGLKLNFSGMFENLQTAKIPQFQFKLAQNRIFILPGIDYKKTSISIGYHRRFIYNPVGIDDVYLSGITCWIIQRFGK